MRVRCVWGALDEGERSRFYFFVCLFLVFGMRECGQMVFWPFLFFLFLANAFFPLVCEIFSLFISKIICFFL
jgi:hypothetical protein